MKGGIHGLKISQVSLVLIAFVCVTVLVLTWTKTTFLTSLGPDQIHVSQLKPDEASQEQNHEGNSRLAQTEDQVGASSDTEHSDENLSRTESKGTDEASQGQILLGNYSLTPTETKKDVGVSSGMEHKVEDGNNENPIRTKGEEIPPSIQDRTGSEELSGTESNSKQEETHLAAPLISLPIAPSVQTEKTRSLSTSTQKKDCNYGKGKWVFDDSRPLYSGSGCKQWLSSMWACRLTQRMDFEYEKLRWQPKDCQMEEFTGSKFLERMRDKTLAFIGDSLGRQQFQSLMCMVTGGEERPDVLDVGYEYGLVKARGHIRPDGWVYRFPSTNTTILYYWSASLCDLEPINASDPATNIAMHLDRPPVFLSRFIHKFDVLVLNTGHHWNRGKLNSNRWVMYVGGQPNTNRKIAMIDGAKNFTIHSIVKWVDSQLPFYPGLKAFLRSISPRHFFNGDWNTGGTCDNTTPLSSGKEVLKDDSSDPLVAGAVSGTKVKLLDITALSELRDEGHISRYSIKATPGVQDCLHWCLPGVPDTWNELLFTQI